MSQIMAGKRSPSKNSVLSICEKLSATPVDLKRIGVLAVGERAKNESDSFYQISVDKFAVMADWYHYALMELTFTKGCQPDPAWMARELGITVQEVKTALERLKRLGLLEIKNGKWKKTHASLTNHSSDSLQTTSARKTLQKQLIQKALEAVDETAQVEKDITSITMAIDPKNLSAARELTAQYRRELCELLERGTQSRVYTLTLQLFPVSKG